MNHYEIVLLISPDYKEQIGIMLDKYKQLIAQKKGKIHRFEDWGRRHLSYQINKLNKAHYILMNIECSEKTIVDLQRLFRFNDAVIRNLVIKKNRAITSHSSIITEKDKFKKTKQQEHVKSKGKIKTEGGAINEERN